LNYEKIPVPQPGTLAPGASVQFPSTVTVCTGCGAVVWPGREWKHDEFHRALESAGNPKSPTQFTQRRRARNA